MESTSCLVRPDASFRRARGPPAHIGEVLEGLEVVRQIESLGSESGKVSKVVVISQSGILEEPPQEKSGATSAMRRLFSWRSKGKQPSPASSEASPIILESSLPQTESGDAIPNYVFVRVFLGPASPSLPHLTVTTYCSLRFQ